MAKQEDKKPTHVVAIPFRDKDNFDKEYAIDQDVSHLDADRLAHLVGTGNVSEVKEAEVSK